jgi:hypothetical protein
MTGPFGTFVHYCRCGHKFGLEGPPLSEDVFDANVRPAPDRR